MHQPALEGPRSAFPLQNELSWRGSAPEFLRRAAQQYGGACKFKLRGREIYLFSDPEIVREILVVKDKSFRKGPGFQKLKPWLGDGVATSEGEMHKRQRRMLQPSFHRKQIELYATIMSEEAEKAAASLSEGEPIDLLHFIETVTFQISTRCIFDQVLDVQFQPFFASMKIAIRYLETQNSFDLADLWKRWTGAIEKDKVESVRSLHNIVDGIIRSRRNDTQQRGDLLSIMISTFDTDGDGKGMTDQELRDQVLTLLVAGFDTISSSLTSCLHQLAIHPEAEQTVVDELKRILAGRIATFGDAMALPKTSAAFSEALRLFPPAWVLPRAALEPLELGGYAIPKDATVLVSSYVNQRNPDYFPNPDEFDLDRWLPEKVAARPKFSYFPFGAGSRVCIGEQFAWLEATILLSALLQKWRFEPAFTGKMPYKSVVSLRSSNGCPMIVRKRL